MASKDVILCFILVLYPDFARTYRYDCSPAERGQNYTLKFTMPYNETNTSRFFGIQRNQDLISTCKIVDGCTDFTPELSLTKLTSNNLTLEHEIIIKTFNSTPIREHQWIFVHSNYKISCEVKVFSRPSNISCNKTVYDDKIYIMCWTSRVYPEMESLVSFKMQNVSKTSFFNRTMICNNTKIQSEPLYYSVKCDLIIPVNDFGPGLHYANVLMFPNITGDHTDFTIGTNTSFALNLDYPTVILENCPEIVEENKDINCTCKRTDKSLFNVSINWFSENCSAPLMGHSRQTLLVKVQRSNRVFCCKANNSLGWTNINSTVSYSTKVIAPIENLTCDHRQNGENFFITCIANGVYPDAHCKYHIINNNTRQEYPSTDGLSENEIMTLNNHTYFNSTCRVNTTGINLNGSHYEIIIIMYQNITLKDMSKQLTAKKSFAFCIDGERRYNPSKSIVIISSTVVAFSVSISFLSLCLIACKGKFLKENNTVIKRDISNNEVEINNIDIYSVEKCNWQQHDLYSRIESLPRNMEFLTKEMNKTRPESLIRYDVEEVVYTAANKSSKTKQILKEYKETPISNQTDIINYPLIIQENSNINRVEINGCAYSLLRKPGQTTGTEFNIPNLIESGTVGIMCTALEQASSGQNSNHSYNHKDFEDSVNSKKRKHLNQYVSIESLIKDTTYYNLKTKEKVKLTEKVENGMTL